MYLIENLLRMKNTGISFIIPTSGTNDQALNQIINSIEIQKIPEYQIIIVGGLTTTVNRSNTIHIPFDENVTSTPWTTRKKNTGVLASKYDVLVIMHDYAVFDENWYKEFENFGLDWDLCVHQNLAIDPDDSSKYIRGNGWRIGQPIPGYPELPWAMTVPYDIDCFIPYMPINGSYWCCKKELMLNELLNENLLWGVEPHEDDEWSSRVVPFWKGIPNNVHTKIVSNSKCITRNIKMKPSHPGNPDWEKIERQFDPLWDRLRSGWRKPGVYHYEKTK